MQENIKISYIRNQSEEFTNTCFWNLKKKVAALMGFLFISKQQILNISL